jgi:hypothetical protein
MSYLLVVVASRVEAAHEAGHADLLLLELEKVRQVARSGLLAGLHQDDGAAVRQALRLEDLQRADRGEDGVAVVGWERGKEKQELRGDGESAEPKKK